MRRIFPALALPVVLVLGACAGLGPAPSQGEAMQDDGADTAAWAGFLPPESDVFASVRVSSFQTLLIPLFPGERGRRLLARTERVLAGLSLPGEPGEPGSAAAGTPGKAADFALVASGDFTPSSVGFPLWLSCKWRRIDRSYWMRKGSSLQVAVPRENLLLAANGCMADLLRRYRLVPEPILPPEVADRMGRAELLLFFPVLPLPAGFPALPVEAAWLEGFPAGEDVRISVVLALAEGSDPRRVESLVRLALAVWLRREGRGDPKLTEKLETLEIRTAEGRLRLEGLLLSLREIEELLAGFLPEEIPV